MLKTINIWDLKEYEWGQQVKEQIFFIGKASEDLHLNDNDTIGSRNKYPYRGT